MRGAAVAGFFTMTHAYNPYSAARLAAQVQAGGGRYLSHFTVQYRGAPERAGHDAALHLQIDSLLSAHLPAWQQQARLDPAGLRQPDSAPRPQATAAPHRRRCQIALQTAAPIRGQTGRVLRPGGVLPLVLVLCGENSAHSCPK